MACFQVSSPAYREVKFSALSIGAFFFLIPQPPSLRTNRHPRSSPRPRSPALFSPPPRLASKLARLINSMMSCFFLFFGLNVRTQKQAKEASRRPVYIALPSIPSEAAPARRTPRTGFSFSFSFLRSHRATTVSFPSPPPLLPFVTPPPHAFVCLPVCFTDQRIAQRPTPAHPQLPGPLPPPPPPSSLPSPQKSPNPSASRIRRDHKEHAPLLFDITSFSFLLLQSFREQ